MSNKAMYGVIVAMMHHVVEGRLDTAIGMCKKILEELESRKGNQ